MPLTGRVDPRAAAVLLPLGAAVVLAALFAPPQVLLLLCATVLLTLVAFTGCRPALWHELTFISLLGFIVLGYGYSNWAFRAGPVPVPVGHVIAASALVLALSGRGREIRGFLREPAVRAWFLMIGLAVAHLVADMPRYGTYAARDASFVAEGAFVALGFLCARREADVRVFLRMMAVVFVVNLVYALTFPFQEAVRAVSPVSGVFFSVPLFGTYAQTALFLLAGSLFFLLLGRRATGWPEPVILVLAVAQAGWSLVLQVRSMYLGMALSALMLVLFGGVRSGGARKALILIGAASLLVFAVDLLQIDLRGRVGQVGSEFFMSHLRSLLLVPGTPGEGTVRWRLDLLPGLWARWTSGIGNILVGEGFGRPLIDYIGMGGVVIRAPHNTHITVAMRLGLAGFAIWAFVHARILSAFAQGLRASREEPAARSLSLWLLMFYALGMLFTTVEPWLEFSYGAVPFFTLVGFAMGLPPAAGASEEQPAEAQAAAAYASETPQ